jgi:hypothetical protein
MPTARQPRRCGNKNIGTRHSRSFVSQIEVRASRDVTDTPELQLLFHRLNNQLGIILAHAELLESKVPDAPSRARASQVVASALEAMATVKDLRQYLVPPSDLSK